MTAQELELGADALECLRQTLARLQTMPPDQRMDVVDWNDRHGRKQSDVVALFDAAIGATGAATLGEATPDDVMVKELEDAV